MIHSQPPATSCPGELIECSTAPNGEHTATVKLPSVSSGAATELLTWFKSASADDPAAAVVFPATLSKATILALMDRL